MRIIATPCLFLFLFLIFSAGCKPQNENPIKQGVKTENGIVKGEFIDSSGITVFRGIPFAAPPIGDFRWKAPQPVKNWEAVLETIKFSASPIQGTPVPFMMWTQEFISPKAPLSEDCLYLNVWTGAKNAIEKRPVFVYIYGGGFNSGSGAVPVYDGEEMAKKGLVFITINYRVGALGFLAHPELTAESTYNSSGNYGLLDQIEALKWVNKNIAEFGGDPSNVTIAGQSAGAFSINYLVASPLTKDLFQRAIAESGGVVLTTNPIANDLQAAEENGKKWAESLGAKSLAELRAKTADEILSAGGRAGPIVDSYVIPEAMNKIFAKGKQNDVPLILGWNKNEGNFGGQALNAKDFKKMAKERYGEKATEFLSLFPAGSDEEAMETQTFLGSVQLFGLQSFAWMNLQGRTGKSPVYMYHFERNLPFGEGMKSFGAFHTGEVPYAYNNLKMSPRPWEKVDYQLAQTMSDYWVNFAKTGNPNGENLPIWESCNTKNQKAIILGEKVYSADLPNAAQLLFLEQFYSAQINNKSIK